MVGMTLSSIQIQNAFFATGIVLGVISLAFIVWPRARFRSTGITMAVAAGTCLVVAIALWIIRGVN